MTLAVLLVATLTVVVIPWRDADADPVTDGPQSRLDELVEGGTASAALLRVTDDGRTWRGVAGTARLDSPGRPDRDGYFRIGSVTKTFVATVVAQLVDEKRFDWDDPIDDLLPGVVPAGEAVTVRHLLNHTSGLYDYMHEEGYSTNRWRGDARFDHHESSELLDVAFGHDPYFEPGDGWHYSNTNYLVLGLLIETSTGMPYGDAVEQRILEPLRLRHTTIPGDEPGLPHPHAHGYSIVDGRTVDATRMNPSLDGPAGEMISTAADLEAFLGALLDARLTSVGALEQLTGFVDTGTDFDYGLGLQRFVLPCGSTLTGSSGQLLGYTTYVTSDGNGRMMTLSVNPFGELDPVAMMAVVTDVYCA